MTAPLAFLDTETDGVHPNRRAWEIACIRREPDGTETQWQAFIDIDLSTADPFGLRVGGFYDRHPVGRFLSGISPDRPLPAPIPSSGPFSLLPVDRAAAIYAQMTHGAHIVGAVPNFDTEVMDAMCRQNGLTDFHHYHLIDIENLAVGYLAAKGTPLAPPWDSEAITLALGLPLAREEERHTAMGDIRWARDVYDAVMSTTALAG